MLCRAGCTHTCAAWQHCMGKPESAKLLLSTVAVGRAPSTSMRTLHLVSSWPCSLACDLVSTPAFVDSSLPCSGFACAQERAGRLPCWCGSWRVFLCFLPSQDAASLRSSKALRMFCRSWLADGAWHGAGVFKVACAHPWLVSQFTVQGKHTKIYVRPSVHRLTS